MTRFVNGRKVALRSGPDKTFGILDRYDSGRELVVTETDGDWSKVRDGLTRREGWILTALLSDERPRTPRAEQGEQSVSKEADTRTGADLVTPTMPQISNSIVIQRSLRTPSLCIPGLAPARTTPTVVGDGAASGAPIIAGVGMRRSVLRAMFLPA
ncbi:SH3 domain-containing protein [Rhizobium leguminosarum]|uniref:SH3 domain-containing protein n=1 Tax=Rhizobium leguminosarum TaxID=384 RepID=UPI001C93F0B1|nr:SH3 domain-containing protein [Rhizobium leguminosarum]